LVEAPEYAVCPLAKQVDAEDDGAALVVCRQRPLGVEDHAVREPGNVARACQCVAHAFVPDATQYANAPLWRRRRWLMQARPWSTHRRGTRPSRYGTATHATPTHPMISINNADGIVAFLLSTQRTSSKPTASSVTQNSRMSARSSSERPSRKRWKSSCSPPGDSGRWRKPSRTTNRPPFRSIRCISRRNALLGAA